MSEATKGGQARAGQGPSGTSNGPAMAAILAAGIGALALGLFVILHEAGVFSAPALYAPAGGLSGRSTFAVAVWLVSWAILHLRWKDREVSAPMVFGVTLVFAALGVILTFPPVWSVFG